MLRCEDCKREYQRGKGWIGFVQEYDLEVSAIPVAPVILFYCGECAAERFMDDRTPSGMNGKPS